MRLRCEIEIINRELASHNLKKPSRSCHAQVSLGRKPVANQNASGSQVYLMVATAKDRNGEKFAIKDNVIQLFSKFVSEGKATIRFKKPEQDLRLSKADPVQLKSLLCLVKASACGQELKAGTLSSLAPAASRHVEKPRTELTVTCRKQYPVTSRFPDTLQTLTVHSCGMKRLDPRILHLRELHHLDLSDNSLVSLPDQWGKVTRLSTLLMTRNQLSVFPASLWKSQVCETLRVLDLRSNQLTSLPVQICELKNLLCLRLDNNSLAALPPTIGQLRHLKDLSLAVNKLTRLPASFARLALDTLDVSDNAFENEITHVLDSEQLGFPTLLECVARTIRKKKIQFSEEDLFPQLYHYLTAARQCWCGEYCFRCSARFLTQASLRQLVASTYTASPGVESVPLEGFLCSTFCLQRFHQNPRAYWRS